MADILRVTHVLAGRFGGHEVLFEEGMKRYSVTVVGSTVSADCEYSVSNPRPGRMAGTARRRVKPDTPKFCTLAYMARNAIQQQATGVATA